MCCFEYRRPVFFELLSILAGGVCMDGGKRMQLSHSLVLMEQFLFLKICNYVIEMLVPIWSRSCCKWYCGVMQRIPISTNLIVAFLFGKFYSLFSWEIYKVCTYNLRMRFFNYYRTYSDSSTHSMIGFLVVLSIFNFVAVSLFLYSCVNCLWSFGTWHVGSSPILICC